MISQSFVQSGEIGLSQMYFLLSEVEKQSRIFPELPSKKRINNFTSKTKEHEKW